MCVVPKESKRIDTIMSETLSQFRTLAKLSVAASHTWFGAAKGGVNNVSCIVTFEQQQASNNRISPMICHCIQDHTTNPDLGSNMKVCTRTSNGCP